MLMELRDNVSRLDAQAYAELKSYKEPPPVVHQIIKAVLAIFHPQQAKHDEFENWDKCKRVRQTQLPCFFLFNVFFVVW